MADNWYLVLGLDFDSAVNEQVIADRIAEQEKVWSRKAREDAFKGSQYKKLLESIPQIKKDMIGAANRRKQLAEEACNEIYSPIDDYLKGIEKNGVITEDEGKKIAEKIAEEIPERKAKYIPGNNDYKKAAEKLDAANAIDIVKKRADKLGIKWDASASLEHYQAIYDKYYKSELQNASQFNEVKENLHSFNFDNLYDFLCGKSNATINPPSSLPCEELRKRASEKRSKFNKHDVDSTIGNRLCSHCEEIFKNEDSKKAYDQYLEYTNCRAILDKAKKIASVEGGLEKGDVYIDQLTPIFNDCKLAEEVFVAFCKVENIFFVVKERTREAGSSKESERPREPEKPKEPERSKEQEKSRGPERTEYSENQSSSFSDTDYWKQFFKDFEREAKAEEQRESEKPGYSEEWDSAFSYTGRETPFGNYEEPIDRERTREPERTRKQKTPIRGERRKGTASRSLFELVRVVVVIWVAIYVLGELLAFIGGFMLNQIEKKSETAATDRYEASLNEFEKSIEESDNDGEASEQERDAVKLGQEDPAAEPEPGQEDPAAATEQESNREDFTDEEWLFNGEDDYSPPHGYEEDEWSYDVRKVYYEAGGNSFYPLRSQLISYISVWAREKEKAEGEEYWADEHIEGVKSRFELRGLLYRRLSHLNPKSVLRYTQEVMDSSIWVELRNYVGDEEADKIDQEMYELIQNEEEVIEKMLQN